MSLFYREPLHRSLAPGLLLTFYCCLVSVSLAQNKPVTHGETVGSSTAAAHPANANADHEKLLLSRTRQLTFAGRRAGEGYFSQDGSELVFQSEREPGNPFFQIYVMNRLTGDIERISPGTGKTTCAWIHSSGNKVLFASTHGDQQAAKKQSDELALRKAGKQRRYSWDYDENYELYEFDRESRSYHPLTDARGYDAEASWSPDGNQVAFTSNRQAYQGELTAKQQKQFDMDPASMNEIYIMDADGSNLQQLTTAAGYDGGPFFSPDGARICWRRFSPDGATAEVWTMNVDGTDKRQITSLEAMSWAPFYHPSGEYLIFTTNCHGFANFELYLVDVAGKSAPVRVTNTDGFDGLPAFTPDGTQLCWTSNRTADGQSQLFLAAWNHQQARQLLGLSTVAKATSRSDSDTPVQGESVPIAEASAQAAAQATKQLATPAYSAADIRRHVEYLCGEELAGRLTGTAGERLATAYVASYLEALGLEPAGDHGSWYQQFEFTSGVALGDHNELIVNQRPLQVDEDWRPLAFSGEGRFDAASLVFAGYGIVAEGVADDDSYDSYVHLDVKDKWVVVLRYLPEDITPEKRQQLNRPSQLRFKATFARDRGALGMIVVTGPNATARSELVPLRKDGILAGSSLPVISVTNEVAEAWFQADGRSLKLVQDKLDSGAQQMGFDLANISVSSNIEIERIKKFGRNVLGRLSSGNVPGNQTIVIGAHVDHLGKGATSSSLARNDEEDLIHYGADDNASGVAAMLEIAEQLAEQLGQGKLRLNRELLFAAWSGEEIGLLGSDHFVKAMLKQSNKAHAAVAAGHSPGKHQAKSESIYPAVAACLNMDMVGRLDKHLILQGVGSSDVWRGEIERRNAVVGLPLVLQEDSYLPTDAGSFYLRGVPILSAFTGAHSDYHTPRDTPDKLNYQGAAEVAQFVGLIAQGLASQESPPNYVQQSAKKTTSGGRLRAYLGTIPDYAEEVVGVMLGGVGKDGPADQAGVAARDIIVELAGKKIENIYDYTHAIEGLKIGDPVKLVVLRKGERVELEITPASRD
ncbi:MAG: M20/M25/M40 family metallo-hydrolase [Bythopirellula sp.]